ncbi:plipastatin synthase subunit D-like [Chelonus insularis]|uniref:plipastatin synthase subunit D-like n=1 Tax=Chelonus insularis TaxID=460826 RepID=UPI00158E6669|nr:plipastatin synthase subunit D-like [Chelonus insularis]
MLRPSCTNGIWKGPEIHPPSEDYFNLGEKIFQQFKKFPEIIGQIDAETGEKDTFAEIGERAVRCALWLQKQGIKKGDMVGFCSGNHLDSVIPMIASFYIGSIFNPWWDSCLDEDISRYFIDLTEPKVLFVHEKLADPVLEAIKNGKNNIKVIIFGQRPGYESFRDILKTVTTEEIDQFRCVKIDKPTEPIMILYTSGTTSYPKGVLHTYGSLTHMKHFETAPTVFNTVNLVFFGIYWVSGVLCTLHQIFTRSTMVICNKIPVDEACKLIEKYKISWISMGTIIANRFSKSEAALKYDLSSVIRASYGGAAAKKEVIEFLLTTFKNDWVSSIYACTETGVILTGKVNPEKAASCGTVIHNAEVKLIQPETGEIVGPNTEGEICFRGPSLMTCYWKNPTATKEAIDSEGWYHTGDLGYYDEDGDFYIVERIKELIKCRGVHVPPPAIESVIQDHPGVFEVAVVAKPNLEDLEHPMAFITKLPGAEVTENEIHELVNSKLHDRMKLRGGICFLDKMPYTASGKISKKELRAMAKKLADNMLRPSCTNGIWKGPEIHPPSEDYFNLGEKIFQQFKKFPEIIGQVNTVIHSKTMNYYSLQSKITQKYLCHNQIDAETGEKDTFAEIGERAVRCALWLQKQGIKKGDMVGFCSGNHLDSVVPMIASFYIGSIFNPWWDSCLDEDISRYFIDLTEPKVLFVYEKLADPVLEAIKNGKNNVKVIIFGQRPGYESFRDILKTITTEEVDQFRCVRIDKPTEPILILYTSGTTGYPKGVLHTYGSLSYMEVLKSSPTLFNAGKLDLSGLHWISGILGTLHQIFTTSTNIICNKISPEEACKLIMKYKISWMSMGTAANRFSKLKAISKYDLSTVIRMNFSGSVVKKEVVEFLKTTFKNATIFSAYGGTENAIALGSPINLKKPTSCGRVFPNVEVKLIKPETGEIVGPNTEGEIYVRGPTLMTGYWRNPTATKEAIDSEGWYHTGDLGYYDEDGDFYIVERMKEMIKFRGIYIPPPAIESVIQGHPGVFEVAVVAKPNLEDLEHPMAFITKLPGAEVTENEIHELVNSKLHDRMKLRGGIRFLDKMPYTASGKISKRELRAMAKKLADNEM